MKRQSQTKSKLTFLFTSSNGCKMANTDVIKTVTDLHLGINTSNKKSRREVIENVLNILEKPEVNEEIVKGICNIIKHAFPVCTDRHAQLLIQKLIIELLEKHPEVTINNLVLSLKGISINQKNLVPTTYTCYNGFNALQWTCLLLFKIWKLEKLEKYIKDIVEIQSLLLTSVVATGEQKLLKKAFNLLKNVWEKIPGSDILYLENLKSLEQNQSIVLLAAAVIGWKSATQTKASNAYVETFVDIFAKFFINTKLRPLPSIIVSCYPLLKEVNSELFKKTLLPSIQKALLRNPEIILECVGLVLTGLSLDLSPFALEIGNSLTASLHSNDVQVRTESAEVCKRLGQKISDVKAIDELLKKVFSVFHGANGKLTAVEHKINVLQGIGNFSENGASTSDLNDLATKTVDQFMKVLDVEVHEKVLSHAIDMLALWLEKITGEMPKKLLDVFKAKMELKTTSVLVRTAYIQCFLTCFKENNINQATILIPVLLKAVERAVAQPTQPSAISEGLCAVCMILKIMVVQKKEQDGLQNMWSTILDMDKQIFISEKYLSSIMEENTLVYVMEMCKFLLVSFQKKIPSNKVTPLYRAVLFCCLSNDTKIRRKCLVILKDMMNDALGPKLSRDLLKELQVFLLQGTFQEKKENDSVKDTFPYKLRECITTLCGINNLSQEDITLLALDSLLPIHQPAVVNVHPDLWAKIIRFHKIDPKTIVARESSYFKKHFVYEYSMSLVNENALSTLIKVNADVILPNLIELVTTQLENSNFNQVTKDDYFVFLTPQDELYDKSVLQGDDNNADMNLKRESKVYSYKEQLEEMQLRKELIEKKKKEGKIKPTQYTPKQLEAIKNQKIKEESIRAKVTELNTRLMNCISMVRAAIKGNPKELSLYFKQLLPSILKNLTSVLAAPHLSELFIDLQKIVFPTDSEVLGEQIAYTTLRLLKPHCNINANWEEEPLNQAMERVIHLIYRSLITKNNKDGEANKSESFVYTAPAFCYMFFLLKYVLLSPYSKKNDQLINNGLYIIKQHSKLRGQSLNCVKDLYHPQYLPTEQMFQLLMDIIANSSGRVQTQAQTCLLDVTVCVSGEPGCAKATTNEIDVLLAALQNPKTVVRDTALRGLITIVFSIPSMKTDPEYTAKVIKRIWIAKFDENEENRSLAAKLWNDAQLECTNSLCSDLIADIEHPVETVQLSASRALAALLEENKEQVQPILQQLLKLYKDRLEVIPAKLDEFGREVEKPIDTWFPRRGVALAITELAPLMTPTLIGELIDFFVSTTLGDRNENVRKEMLNAALRIVDIHGKETVSTLWPVFDNFMGKSSKSAHFDAVKQAVVILMGSLARHLDKDDPRIKPIVGRLIQALSTPSQTVQEAVANCLPHLVPSIKEEATGYINKLLHQLLKGDKYGERRGAAYGLAGLVKGLGILALKQHDIMTKLTDAIQEKKNYKHREGALFAFEMLFQMLGKLFEPYIVHVLPHLLQCFGDTSQYVRTAADDTAKVVMSKLSGHGVKLVLPSLLAVLEEDSWRTKTGSVELLGDMAYCAPKQLSSCLPSIVPKLIEVLSDSHMKVQEAGATALKVIGSVIRNPEIQAIVPVLLQALQDPSNKTSLCLQTLLDTKFVHFIDAPSLALIMPVVQRAFMDRSTETRKMAAQIIGNMYSLTDQKDLLPYLPTIIPGLKTSLLDPVPEVRSVSARALGAMVRGMGESSFEDLLPWLMSTLTSETSSVDRSGAAQGLSEVVGGLGVEKLHKLMPEIIATAERTDIAPHVKDGYIMMFIYMPVVFTTEFTPYIGQIINPILKALADENEYVRDTALKAGQRIVTLYADSAILLLLPELEKGLFDDNWRIRYSSVQLLGDLLYRISGVTGKMSTETASEDDNFGTEQSHQAIIKSLGAERRNRVLAGLYMGRSDVALMVRQAALHVWKVVVTNTPRTLREILPTLFSLLLGCLASDSYDKRQVAARTLGDLVRKLGERVLPEIIPILENGLQSDQSDQRQGVCIGLSEIMASTSKEMVLTYVNSLVPTVRKALCDPLPEVRQAAAKTFDSLHATVGARALDDILPTMLNKLNDEDPEIVEWTLDGLRQVMALKSRVVLPYLVPQLTAPPANTKALSILASVAGEALNKYLPRILPALQTALASSRETPEESQQLEYCQTVVLSVVDETGIRTIIDTMLENTRNENPEQRRAAATLLCVFCANSKAQYTAHVPQLFRGLIHLCTDSEKEVLQMSWEALNAVVKTLDAKQQATYVSDIRQAVRYAMSDLKGSDLLPGFCIPKGIAPILPIFREAILNGDGDEKEGAAQGLGEVIKVTSAEALQPSVVAITGPLIRILGDRFNANVKTAVLDTLAILLSKVGVMLKQFLPQLQTTFIKALNDPNRIVRLKSANALSYLILIHQRADPLFTELHNTIKNTDDSAIKETTLHALRGIITPAGDKMSDNVKSQVLTTLLGLLNVQDDSIRNCAAGCLGALCKWLTPQQLETTLFNQLLTEDSSAEYEYQGKAAALSVALKESAKTVWTENYKSKITDTILRQLQATKTPVTQAAIRSCGYLLQHLMINDEQLPNNLLVPFVRTMNNISNEVKQHLAKVSIHLAKNVPPEKMSSDLLKLLLPTLVNGTKEKNSFVKANSEMALIALLRLKEGDATLNKCLSILDLGARESLSDVISKVLKKLINQPEGKEEELDDTLLT